MILQKLKPFTQDIIKYYYDLPENGAGGSLHIVLDDGNIDYGSIGFCRNWAEENKDSLGILLCDLLEQFTEEDLQEMYENNWSSK